MATLLAILVAGALLGLALLFASRARGTPGSGPKARARGRAQAAGSRPAPKAGGCALCGSVLGSGERMKSDITRGPGDRLMRIFGCPHCLPGPAGQEGGPEPAERFCPVCRARIPGDGWAIARYFERPGRRHVHILGCTVCRPRAR